MADEEINLETEWLKQLVGEWTWEIDPASEQREGRHGTEAVRTLGESWIVAETTRRNDDGTESVTLMTLAYNRAKNAYVGMFIGSMMPDMFKYEGWLDISQNMLVLDTTGPSFVDPSHLCRYKDTIRIIDSDNRVLKSSYQAEGGSWYVFMTANYRRQRRTLPS